MKTERKRKMKSKERGSNEDTHQHTHEETYANQIKKQHSYTNEHHVSCQTALRKIHGVESVGYPVKLAASAASCREG